MRLDLQRLGPHLKGELLSLYLVAGDEPLQRGEALDAIRAAARARGFVERELLQPEAGGRMDWGALNVAGQSLSLFAERRLLEVRLESAKLGKEGVRALSEYAAAPPPDALLLVALGKLDARQRKSKWYRELDRRGGLVEVWPLDHRQLPGWLARRMRARGLEPGPGVAEWLAGRVEGNLLAAAQEVERLLLLRGPGPLALEDLGRMVADSARYSVFDFSDALLAGDAARALHVLRGLREEGEAPVLVLWALARDLRLLAGLAAEVEHGTPPARALGARRDLWDKRKTQVGRALGRFPAARWRALLGRCLEVDRAAKGVPGLDPWVELERVTMAAARPSADPRARVPRAPSESPRS